MAFEHGSLDLGIRNPFRTEGVLTAFRGLVVAVVGLWLVLGVQGLVQDGRAAAWTTAIVGALLLGGGIAALGRGIFQMMRFFVGRSVPTSLAFNYSKSERDTAQGEHPDLQYTANQIEQMLMGRKNITFEEPRGWVARLIHSLFPKLTFLPYPIRNLAQRLAAACVNTAVAAVAFTLAWFTVVTGLAGDAGDFMISSFSFVLLLYLMTMWYRSGAPISRSVSRSMESTGRWSLAWIVALSILLPVALGLAGGYVHTALPNMASEEAAAWEEVSGILGGFSSAAYIWTTAILSALATAALLYMVAVRAGATDPATEVSELRDNWQEPVHPRDIFINIDNIVMANRRYLQVPNRIYRDLVPKLNEDADGKGSFFGEMIQETQPAYRAPAHSPAFRLSRLMCTAFAQILYVAAAIVVVYAIDPISAIVAHLGQLSEQTAGAFRGGLSTAHAGLLTETVSLLNLAIAWLICAAFARLLGNMTHVFWGEMQFESLLIYFKCEGTFTESRLSTGTGIYDSTRSENRVVRSSITPWLIVSRIMSSTFAGIGERNLEYPRHILEMRSDDDELNSIVGDLKTFLGNREAIAGIRNERDLGAASNIFRINQQTRALSVTEPADTARLTRETEEAGGAERCDDMADQKGL